MQILAIVVLYEKTPSESETLTSLSRTLHLFPDLLQQISILAWDNSAVPARVSSLGIRYHHSGSNVGLSRPYNTAAAMACEEGIPWLLLLDQDTSLPEDFLHDMLAQATRHAEHNDIAAIVPTVLVGGVQASPWRVLFNAHTLYPSGGEGYTDGEAAAINSGSLLRVSSLLQIGGYSEAFWLDYSDWYVFHRLYAAGFRVWHAASIRIEHSMTVMDYDTLMHPLRYRNFIAAEGAFSDMFHGRARRLARLTHLIKRAASQRRRLKNPEFSRITLRYLLWRLLKTRTQRVEAWTQAAAARRSGGTDA